MGCSPTVRSIHLLSRVSQSLGRIIKFVTTCVMLRLGGELVVNLCFINLSSFIDSLSIFNMVSKLGFFRGKFVLHDIVVCSKVLKF